MALIGFWVMLGLSRNQAGDKGAEQGFAASARVVHELEEAETKQRLVLRDAAVRAQPGAQQGPFVSAAPSRRRACQRCPLPLAAQRPASHEDVHFAALALRLPSA